MFAPSKSFLPLLVLASLVCSDVAHASWTKTGPSHFEIEGEVGPIGDELHAESSSMSAVEQAGKLVLSTNLYALDFGMAMKTTKFRQAFGVTQTTKAKLAIALDALEYPEQGESADGTVSGAFTLHGVTRTVQVDYEVSHAAPDHYVVSAEFSFDYTKFGVAPVCLLAICVDEIIDVHVNELELVHQ